MTEDEREHLLRTVRQAHAGLSEVALTLRLGVPPKTPARQTAMKAERAAFELKRALQRLDVKDVAVADHGNQDCSDLRRTGRPAYLHVLHRTSEPHDADVDASAHAADQRVQQEA